MFFRKYYEHVDQYNPMKRMKFYPGDMAACFPVGVNAMVLNMSWTVQKRGQNYGIAIDGEKYE